MVLFFLHIHFFCIINIMQVVTVILIFNHWVICWSFFFDIQNIIEWSDISFTALVKTIFIHSCYNISDSNSTKYSHLFFPMIFYVCCNFNKLFFESSMYVPCFFTLYLFIVIKVTKKMKSATAQVDCYTNVDKRIVEDELVQKPTHMIFFIFTFLCISNVGLYYSIFFLCYIY